MKLAYRGARKDYRMGLGVLSRSVFAGKEDADWPAVALGIQHGRASKELFLAIFSRSIT